MQHPPCNSKDVRQHPPPPPHSLRITYLASLLLPRISLPHLPSLVFPPPRSTQGPDIVSTGMDLDPLIFDRAVSSALPMVPIEFFTSLFSLLSPNIVTSLVSLLLMESPLLLVSRELSALTNISEALCALLFPLSWCGIYIPVTPRGFDLDAALEAPLPFIIGTNVGDHTSAEGTAGGDHVGLSAETLEVCMRCKVTIVDIDGDRLISENYAIIRGTSWDVREAATAAAADRRRRSEGHFLPIPSEDPVAAARKGGHNGPAMMPLPGRTDRSWSVAGLGIPEPFLSRMTSSVAAASRGIPVPEETRKRWGSKARRTTLSGLADDLLIRRSSIDASSGGGRYSSGRGQGAGGGGGNSRGGNGRGNGRSGNGRSGNGGGGGGGDGSTPMWECRDGRHNKWERVSGNVGVDTLAASPMKRLAEAFERRRALQAARPTEEDDAHRREAARFKAKTCRAALQSLVNVWIDPAAAAGACADGRGGGGQGGGVSGRVGGGGDVRRLVNDVRACFLEFFLQILSNYDRYLPKPPAPGTKQTRQQMNETFDAEAFLRNRTVASSFLRRLVTTQMFAVLTYAAQMARLPSTEETEGTEGIMEARLFDSLLDSTEWRNHRAEPKAYLRWRGELSVRGSTAGVSLSERGGGVGGMGRSGGVGSRTSDGRGGQRSTRTLRPTQKVRSLKQSSSAPSGISLKGINSMGRARGLGGGPRSASVPRRPLLVRAMPPSGATCADDSALPMLNVYGREGGSGGSDGRATDGYLGGGGARGHFPRLSLRYFLSPRPLSGPPVVDVPPLSAVPFAVIVESDTSSPVTPGERRRTSYGDLSRPRPALLAKLAKLRVDIDREDRGGGGEDSDDTTTDSDDSEGAVETVPTFGVEPDVPMAQVT